MTPCLNLFSISEGVSIGFPPVEPCYKSDVKSLGKVNCWWSNLELVRYMLSV